MATEHDGSVKIDTTLDTTGFRRGAQDLQRAAANLTKSIENAGGKAGEAFSEVFQNTDTGGMQAVQERIDEIDEALEEARQKAEQARQALDAFSATKVESDKYKKLLDDIDKAAAAEKELRARMLELDQDKSSAGQAAAQSAADQWRAAAEQLKVLQIRADNMLLSGDAMVVSPESRAELEALQKAVQDTQAALNSLQAQQGTAALEDFAAAEESVEQSSSAFVSTFFPMMSDAIQSFGDQLGQILHDFATNPAEAIQTYGDQIGAALNNLPQTFGNVFTGIKDGMSASLEAAGTDIKALASRFVSAREAAREAGEGGASAGQKIAAGFKSAIKTVDSVGVKVRQLIATIAKTGAQKALSGIKSLVRGIKNIGKHSGKSALTANALTRSIFGLKNMLFSRIKQTFITYLFNQLQKGIQELAKYDTAFDQAVSNLRNRTTELAANITSGLGTLVKAIEPYITAIIDAASNAVAKISALLARLTGQNTVIVAKKQTESYAASLNGSADSAKKAADAQKKLNKTLSSYDQLHKLDGNNDTDAGRADENGAEGMFETVPVAQILGDASTLGRNIVDSIRQSIATGDWAGVGRALAVGINALNGVLQAKIIELKPVAASWAAALAEGLNGLTAGLDGWNLGKTLAETVNLAFGAVYAFITTYDWTALGTLIGDYLNGVFLNIDWPLIGGTLAESFNGVIDTIYGAVTTFDWVGAAANLASGISTIIHTVDWKHLGETLSELLKGALDFLITAIAEIDWAALGESILEFLEGIDWVGICDKLLTLVGAILGGLFEFLKGVVKHALEKLSEWWNGSAFDEAGQFTLDGLIKGLLAPAAALGDWAAEHIGKPIIDGFKKALGIASPSKVMAEQGAYLVDGLKNGVSSEWGTVQGMVTGNADNLVTAVGATWKALKDATKKQFEGVGQTMLDKMQQAATDVEECISNVQQAAADGFDALKTEAGHRWEDVKQTISNKADAIRGLLPQKWQQIITNASQSFASMNSTISGLMSGLWSQLTQFDFSYVGTCLISGIQNGINKAWTGFWNYTTGLFGGLTEHVKNIFGISSPSKVFAEIGGYLMAGLDEGIEAKEPAMLRSVASVAKDITDSMAIKTPDIGAADIGSTENSMLAHLSAVADRLAGIARTFAAIDRAITSMGGVRVPAMATGTIIPPSTRIAVDRDSTPETDPEIIQLLRRLIDAIDRREPQGDSTRVPIEIVSKIDRRELARAVTEIEIQNGRLTNGRSRA